VDTVVGGGELLQELLLGAPLRVEVARRTAYAARVRATLEGNARCLHHVQRRPDVGLTPGRLRVLPPSGRLDEVVGLARRAADPVVDLRLRRRGEKRGCPG